MRARALSTSLILAFLLLPRAGQAVVEESSLTCPVDGGEVQVAVPLSTDSLLGHDRDLCPHAAGDDEVRTAVSACPRCGFAGTASEFRMELPEGLAERVKRELKPATTAWERYANRARILEWESAPQPKIGESWLRAAWSVRLDPRPLGDPALEQTAQRLLSAPSPGGEGKDPILDPARALQETLESKAPRRESAGIAAGERALAWYLVGAAWRRRGELGEAESRYTKALAEAGPSGGAVPALVARDRSTIDLEREYLQRALEHFRSALVDASKVPSAQRAMLAFLAGETARRTGRAEEASRFYRITEALSDDPAMKPLVREGLEETGRSTRP